MKTDSTHGTDVVLAVGSAGWWLGFMLLFAGLLTACGGDPTATSPEKIFEDGFETPLSEVKIEAEGGTRVRGFEAWLKILPDNALVLRHEEKYGPMDCIEPRIFFNKVLGTDELAAEHAFLDCLGATDIRFDFDNGRWLVHNRTNGRYYYRVWKAF